MNPIFDRRACLAILPAVATVGLLARRGEALVQPEAAGYEGPGAAMLALPAQDPAKVREMVIASHGNIEKVRGLLKDAPRLANAAFDWGFGDWETALGAASHTGRRELAALLLEHGARPDIFAFAMLGHTDVVRAMVTAQPGIQRVKGPHGLTLMHHARVGGDGSKAVVEYLTTLGDADQAYVEQPLEATLEAVYIGAYSFGAGADQRLEVSKREGQKQLSIQRPGRFGRGLFHLGDDTFHPAGAPEVRIVFTVENQRAVKLVVTSPGTVVEAGRV